MANKPIKPIKPAMNGRGKNGQFSNGNQLAIGHLGKQKTEKARLLKLCFLDTITVEDMKDIAKKIVEMAKAGDVTAAKEVFDRCFGKALQTHEIDVEVRTYTQEECDNIRKMLAVRFVDAKPKKAS